MDRGTRVFWAIVLTLFVASGVFGVRAAAIRRAAAASNAAVQTGDLVTLSQVVDGDTVVVRNPAGDEVPIRILGVKSLKAQGKDPVAIHGQLAAKALERAFDRPPRVLLGTPSRDKHGRTLATLFHDEQDVALELVKNGLLLVYTPFPFPAMQQYLAAQTRARAERKGLWADPAAVSRADALFTSWRNGAE